MDLKTAIGGGVLLGVSVFVWDLVAIGGGLLDLFVPVATLIEIVVLVGALWRTRTEQAYLGQLATGSALGLVGAVGCFVASLIATTVVFPDALPALAAETQAQLEQAQVSPAEIEASVALIAPVPQALFGAIGTLVTGVVVSALLAIRLRRRAVT